MVMERKGPSTFSYGVERISKTELRVHRSLEATVYAILLGIFSSDIVKQKHYYFMFQFSMNFFRGIVADIFPLSCPLCLICWHCFCEGRSPYVEVCKMTSQGVEETVENEPALKHMLKRKMMFWLKISTWQMEGLVIMSSLLSLIWTCEIILWNMKYCFAFISIG